MSGNCRIEGPTGLGRLGRVTTPSMEASSSLHSSVGFYPGRAPDGPHARFAAPVVDFKLMFGEAPVAPRRHAHDAFPGFRRVIVTQPAATAGTFDAHDSGDAWVAHDGSRKHVTLSLTRCVNAPRAA